jgi:hypothetical protein
MCIAITNHEIYKNTPVGVLRQCELRGTKEYLFRSALSQEMPVALEVALLANTTCQGYRPLVRFALLKTTAFEAIEQ